MNISFAVQTHPSRLAAARGIAAQVDGEIVLDPGGLLDTWRSNRLLWSQTPVGASHRVCLQDDVELCPGFARGAQNAIEAHPDVVVAFFCPEMIAGTTRLIGQAVGKGHPWVIDAVQGFVPMQALAMPVDLVADMLEWTDANPHPFNVTPLPWLRTSASGRPGRPPNDDEIVARWMRARRVECWYTAPSLVQHDTGVPSTIGSDGIRGRQARFVLDVDAGGVDW